MSEKNGEEVKKRQKPSQRKAETKRRTGRNTKEMHISHPKVISHQEPKKKTATNKALHTTLT
jgi:hypothetical protein